MSYSSRGIHRQEIGRTPISLVDLETTGLSPGNDRVVEASVLRFDPGIEPRIVFDTLVNPGRKMAGTEIHGISEADVEDAPGFEEIAGDFIQAVSDSVLASYNVRFDIRFLQHELGLVGVEAVPPHFCLMYLRPMLGLGKKQPLDVVCREYGIQEPVSNAAAETLLASGKVFERYLEIMKERGISRFGDLAALADHDFLESFDGSPCSVTDAMHLKRNPTMKSRHFEKTQGGGIHVIQVEEEEPWKRALSQYWNALKTAVADYEIDGEELAYLQSLRRDHDLPEERIRVLHARAFASLMDRYVHDEWLDDEERGNLRRLHHALSTLGWAPGE